MIVQPITSNEQLLSLQSDWNALAEGNPLRSWDWLATWWNHYGLPLGRQLRLLAVYEEVENSASKLLGIAPWYLEPSRTRGNVLRPLGSGEVCTDHLSLISLQENRSHVAKAVAKFLVETCDDWDQLVLDAVDAEDEAITELMQALEQHECLVSRREADACWIVDLPGDWEEYLAILSKSHRKQIRRAERKMLHSGRAVWHRAEDENGLEEAWPLLVDLHQRRRKSLGEPGCFASHAFHDFHHEVAQHLLPKNQLRLSWLEIDGKPAAAEYHFAGQSTTYAYQSGIDPERLEEGPGQLSIIKTMQAAIQEGHHQFDFMRGDEPYKAHWRATPHPSYNYRVVPNKRLAKLRGRVIHVAGEMIDWARQSAQSLTN